MLDPRVLGIRLHPLELGLGANPLDFELGDEDGHVSRARCDERDGPLGGQEAEAREVLDVLLVEEHVAGELLGLDVLQEPLAPRAQLCGRNAGHRLHRSSGLASNLPNRWRAAPDGLGSARSIDPPVSISVSEAINLEAKLTETTLLERAAELAELALDTPEIVLDLDVVRANIDRAAAMARDSGVVLRPHTKTHKLPQIAHMQLEAGAVGVQVAKLGEAEVMADAGIDDILVGYPIVGAQKLARLADLAERVSISVTVDSDEVAAGHRARRRRARVTIPRCSSSTPGCAGWVSCPAPPPQTSPSGSRRSRVSSSPASSPMRVTCTRRAVTTPRRSV